MSPWKGKLNSSPMASSLARFCNPSSQKIRSIYKRAISNVDAEDEGTMVREWIHWERMFGNDLEPLVEYRNRMILMNHQKEAKTQKRKSTREDQHSESKRMAHGAVSMKHEPDSCTGVSTHHGVGHESPSIALYCGPTAMEGDEERPGMYTVFLSNLPFSMEKSDLMAFLTSAVSMSNCHSRRWEFPPSGI